ncbi:hypothetical protein [Vibrio campbellii]|uniref:hypothetical protein n=1 Tax=Vibrio campbellii TaxID=680 RepID=UPI001F37996C|nr:hypothetical protein [Vibrio campbellii]MCE7729351.1 hypothetical protein [Vibrio campbellii]
MINKRGRAKTEENRESYSAYIANLEATGKKFPINQRGSVNIDAVAKACGFNRQVLYNSMREQFDKDVKRIGTMTQDGTNIPEEERLAEIAETSKKNASRLQATLDAKDLQIQSLKDTVDKLKQRIDELESDKEENKTNFEETLSEGRSFNL